MEQQRGQRKVRVGTVVSAKTPKTIIVRIDRRVTHPEYRKVITRAKRVMAHDEEGQAKVGDVVRIMETRPLSKRKRWRYLSTVRAAE